MAKKSNLNSLDTFEKFLREIQTNHDKVGALYQIIRAAKVNSLMQKRVTIAQRRNTFHGKCDQSVNIIGRRKYIPESELSVGAKVTRTRLAGRFATMDFPFESCMEALKQNGTTDLRAVADTLLTWFQEELVAEIWFTA